MSLRAVEKERIAFSLVCFNLHSHATSIWVWPTQCTVMSLLLSICLKSSSRCRSAASTVG